ncbi:MAG TPA: hypothetical protein VKN36_01260 [Eudoraea sp.]|nr:hypothetical protein [Eudoraea sp.]
MIKKLGMLWLGICVLHSCQIREEISFKEDGSGMYQMAFDMSEMMKMGDVSDSLPPEPPVDTLINFASFLDEKRDSISRLPKEESSKLEALRPLQFAMKVNEEEKQMDINLQYAFQDVSDISKFADAINQADIKELKEFTNPMAELNQETTADTLKKKDGMNEMFSIAESFTTAFSKAGFKRTITEKAMADAIANKDTTLKADDPFVDLIRFKQVYKFPYKIRKVSNKNAKILSDFKGVEIEANMYELSKDPKFFNIEVEFEQ